MQTPMFEQYMTRLVIKIEHQKDICSDEIDLRAQNKDTILGSVLNSIGRAYVIASRERKISILTF